LRPCRRRPPAGGRHSRSRRGRRHAWPTTMRRRACSRWAVHRQRYERELSVSERLDARRVGDRQAAGARLDLRRRLQWRGHVIPRPRRCEAREARWSKQMNSIGEATFGLKTPAWGTDGPQSFRTLTQARNAVVEPGQLPVRAVDRMLNLGNRQGDVGAGRCSSSSTTRRAPSSAEFQIPRTTMA
jgi:hypothetical protein